MSPANFKRVEITEDAKPDWTDKETLHLLEAVLHYGEDWKKFMGHKEDRMRFENIDDNTDEPGANVSKLYGRNF
uniref:Myb-like domain-containing protein n=1 Tax=Zea mays TaxID=4577 RepID=A0A804NZ91_MAIZE